MLTNSLLLLWVAAAATATPAPEAQEPPAFETHDPEVLRRLETIGILGYGDKTALTRVQPSIRNVLPPPGSKGGHLTCPSVSGSYSFSYGGRSTSGSYRVSGSCVWIPRP